MALRYGLRIAIGSVRKPVARMSFSTFTDREHGEEARYIRKIEADRQAAMRAKMESILALEDSHEDKKDLLELLEEKPKTGLLSKYGLDDWKFALPVGLLLGIPALANEVIILDGEMQLTACFILFCSTLYTQVGSMVGKSLDDRGKEIFSELKQLDDTLKGQINAAVASNTLALSLHDDLKSRYQLVDDLATTQADVLNHLEEHKYREAIVKKLDSLHALEEATAAALRARTIAAVKAEVVETFTNDRKAKDNALAQAMAVLSAGAKGKMGRDIVGDAFSAALNNYKESYQKNGKSDPILEKLEAEMINIAQAPVVEGKGGNVYVTHAL